ncbi:sialate O-acetylesterase [Anaerosporobacter faecicola]|uniref:sialate O-acetylesterase n=1 Tax=Anaerosporobacter faecicola TaxID=2718714 RepID=UPI00143BA610|nr:sialate O-acetylesterase [Anaerosporobacter faecicola]
MEQLRFDNLFGEGMVLQRESEITIWGTSKSESTVHFKLMKIQKEEIVLAEKSTIADSCGKWEVTLYTGEAQENCRIQVKNDVGEKVAIENVCIGDVYLCVGQSNMELPMERVKDCYPEVIRHPSNRVRELKVVEHSDFHNPCETVEKASWSIATPENIEKFSATAYFFGEEVSKRTKVSIGLINTSLGGSRIQSWMSKEMLKEFPVDLALASKYGDDTFVKEQIRKNERQANAWYDSLEHRDVGMHHRWYEQETDLDSWDVIHLPQLFCHTPLEGFIGVVWLQKIVTIPKEMVGKEANLWLGTMVDRDEIYINGIYIGGTPYQYPPRKYTIPEGILRVGDNTITIRLFVENGEGRVTPEREYEVFTGSPEKKESCVSLEGNWYYRIGATAKQIPPTDFVNWKPTGLYNGMVAPCRKYGIKGILWYQGEGNTDEPMQYGKLMRALLSGYRTLFQQENLPFYYVQLPNFSIDLEEDTSGWPKLREEQEKILDLPYTGMACGIDLGEDNDLHPLNKKEVGERLAKIACAKLYGYDLEYSGPRIGSITIERGRDNRNILITCEHAKMLYVKDRFTRKETENPVIDFEVAGEDGRYEQVKADIEKNQITIRWPHQTTPVSLRYCHGNTPKGAILYNEEGLPMAPFERQLL